VPRQALGRYRHGGAQFLREAGNLEFLDQPPEAAHASSASGLPEAAAIPIGQARRNGSI
jgi:hypothetical protein